MDNNKKIDKFFKKNTSNNINDYFTKVNKVKWG